MSGSVLLLAGLVIGSMTYAANADTNSVAERPVPGGWSPVSMGDDRVKAAAQHAVAAQALATGTQLKLSSIQDARRQVVAGINYKLTLSVVKGGKQQSAKAVVWAKLDGTYELTAWSWE